MHAKVISAMCPPSFLQSKRSGLRLAFGVIPELRVVGMLSVVIALPFAAKLMVGGLKLQPLSDGRTTHADADSVTVPLVLNPLIPVKVSTVVPAAPGALTGMVAGFAVTVNVGVPPATVTDAELLDPW